MSFKRLFPSLLAPALLATAAVCSGLESPHAAARAAIDAGRFAEASGILTPLVQPVAGQAADPEALYLLGVSGFRLVDQEITREREQGAQKVDELIPAQVERLKESLARLRLAQELSPGADFAPEAAFLEARIQDFGYLQRFDVTQAAYRRVVQQYPGTDAARRAQERVIYYENLFKHGALKPPTMH